MKVFYVIWNALFFLLLGLLPMTLFAQPPEEEIVFKKIDPMTAMSVINDACNTATPLGTSGSNVGALGGDWNGLGGACTWGSTDNSVFYSFEVTANTTPNPIEITFSNVQCTGGGSNLQLAIYANCSGGGGTADPAYRGCANGVGVVTLVSNQVLTPGTYILVMDGSSGANCTWEMSGCVVTAPPAFTPATYTGCVGDLVNFTDESIGCNISARNWSFPGGTPATSTDANPSVSYAAPGAYSVTLSVTDANGTRSQTYPQAVVINIKPEANITPTTFLPCIGGEWCLSGIGTQFATFHWTGPNGFVSNQFYSCISPFMPQNSGVYSLTTTLNGCTSSTATIIALDISPLPPTATFSIDKTTVCLYDVVETTYTGNDVTMDNAYTWYCDNCEEGDPFLLTPNPLSWSTPGVKTVTLQIDDVLYSGAVHNYATGASLPLTDYTAGCAFVELPINVYALQNPLIPLCAQAVSVKLNITHPRIGDLNIHLIAPDGKILQLTKATSAPLGADFINTIFQNGSPSLTGGTAPYTGTFRPTNTPLTDCAAAPNITSFADFVGIDPNGTWILRIYDAFPGMSGFATWSISFPSILGCSSSESVEVTVLDPCEPLATAPINFKGRASLSENELSWNDIKDGYLVKYVVEKKKDNGWQTLREVKAERGQESYKTTDKNPDEGVNYYRLKTVDLDGKSTIAAPVVELRNDGSRSPFTAYYDVSTETISLTLPAGFREETEFSLYDGTGRRIASYPLSPENAQTFNVKQFIGALTAGIYVVKVGAFTQKFWKN